MATQVQFRRGTTAQNNAFTGAAGEISVDTDKDSLVVHDGSTQGGFGVAKNNLSNVASVGILTATSFSGDGSTLSSIPTSIVAGDNISVSGSTGAVTITGLANTSNVSADTLVVTGISTVGIVTGATSLGVTDVYATTLYGNGSNLTGITAGATLSAGSGSQRVVVTSLTSGTMTSAATDAELTYNSGTNALTATSFVGALTGNVTGNSAGTHTGAVDLNGGVLTLDADADTTITADTDDQIDIAFGGNDRITLSSGLIDLKNDGSQSALRLYCETSNAHYAALQAPAHSDFSGNITLTLPATSDTLVGRTATQTLTNKTLTSPTITGTGAIAGAFTGNLTGNVTGNVTGNTSGTAGGLTGAPSITVADITATGNVSIAGTLTYEDVNSVDSVGIVTARTGVRVTTGGIVESAGGITGTHANIAGIVTANSFRGDGSNLTGITAAGTGAIGGLTIKNQSGTVVGTAGSVSTLNFDGSSGVSVTATSGASGVATIAISAELSADTSPQLGGDLDINSNDITGTGDINITGNIALSGTVDGRDVATDGTKLDGIEASATADQTAAEIRTLVESASDSNVFTDADHSKLNGIASGATNVTNNNQLTNGAGYVTSNTQLSDEQVQDIVGAMVSSNSESGITVTYQDGDGTIDFSVSSQTDNNFTTALKNKLDGIAASATNVTNNNQLTNGAGYITSANGGNAATLDSIDSSQFLRSDTSDQKTSGTLRFNDNVILSLGSSDDAEFFVNGSHLYLDLNSGIGDFYIRDGSTTRFSFDDAGHFTASGNITANSDITLKENIETIPNALDKVLNLRGVEYDRIDIEGNPHHIGVIAQEIEEVIPEVVSTNDEGIKSVAYGNIIGVLIEAVKEQQKQINDLKDEIKSMKG